MATVVPLIVAGRVATNPLPSGAMPAMAPPPALAAAGIMAGVHVAAPSADRHAAEAGAPPAVVTVPASTITVPLAATWVIPVTRAPAATGRLSCGPASRRQAVPVADSHRTGAAGLPP